MAMNIKDELHKAQLFNNLELLAQQVVEGFISGIHKSPFHGYSAEFAEHKIYNTGESTKHVDWKLFAKTDKLYTKQYEEETNMRCHIVIDNSSSMHYPKIKVQSLGNLNKIGFSVLASAAIMNFLKRQRDAVGLSVFSDTYEFYSAEKTSTRHYQVLLSKLNGIVNTTTEASRTNIYDYLHQIAEKMRRRSLVILFTDMLQPNIDQEALFKALHHLKYNKHEVVFFHVHDKATELNFEFPNAPKRYVDVETGEFIDLYSDSVKEAYKERMDNFFKSLEIQCLKYKIKYIPVDIKESFTKILNTYLIERQKFK